VQNIKEYVEVEKTVEVNVLENRIKDALEEANGSIESKAKEAYNKVYEREVKKIEDAVKAEYISEIEATISSVEY
jgi:tartrate dehydratase alpha subunit/fumarate hydratase class I-like protein